MYLVDTSVWVDYLQGRESDATAFLETLLDNPLAIAINHQVYLEILQGAKDETNFEKLKRYFSGQRFVDFRDRKASYGAAARLYFECRRVGITVRSSIDCLIAQCALENKLALLHADRDYLRMQAHIPGLSQKHFLQV